jgi:hypothetical protein
LPIEALPVLPVTVPWSEYPKPPAQVGLRVTERDDTGLAVMLKLLPPGIFTPFILEI